MEIQRYNQIMAEAKKAANHHFLYILGNGWKLLGRKNRISPVEGDENKFRYNGKFQNGTRIASVITKVYKPLLGSQHVFEDQPIQYTTLGN